MPYLFLALTIIFESAAIIFMKLSSGFENKAWGAAATLAYLASYILLTMALKDLPMGVANATWAGASTVLVAIFGVLLFREELSTLQLLFLAMIVAGLIGLNLVKSG